MDIKKTLAIILAILLFAGIVYYALQLSQPQSSQYSGLKDDTATTQVQNGQIEQITGANGQVKNIQVATDPAFNPRSLAGGGDGWLVSVTESQPKIFTGRLLYNNGVENYNVFLQEQDGFFTGDAKKADGTKAELSLQKQAQSCTDKENNTFEYTLVATFQGGVLNGCGGSVISTSTAQ